MQREDFDPWNNPSDRHARAAALMQDPVLWDCINELAPFGSDEGADAFTEYCNWRAENPDLSLIHCISWILGGNHAAYDDSLTKDEAIRGCDESAQGFDYPDAFTLDATVIATVLGQLVSEGKIDAEAKPFAIIAIRRQSHPLLLARFGDSSIAERREILRLVQQVIEAA